MVITWSRIRAALAAARPGVAVGIANVPPPPTPGADDTIELPCAAANGPYEGRRLDVKALNRNGGLHRGPGSRVWL